MFNRLVTLQNLITLSNPSIPLPKFGVIDKLILRFALTISNTSGSAGTCSTAELLNAIREIRVSNGGSTLNYSISGYSAAILETFRKMGRASTLAGIGPTASIANNGSTTHTFQLELNEGDLPSLLMNDIALEIAFNQTIKTGFTLSAATVTTTVSEYVYTRAEFDGVYGSNAELRADPKVYEKRGTVAANTALTDVLSLPVNNLLRRAIVLFYADNAASPELTPDNIGIMAAADRKEILNVDAKTLRSMQNCDYFQNAAAVNRPAGAFLLDYANTLTSNGYGLKGWDYGVDDFQLQMKTPTAGKIVYISVEHTVDVAAWNAGAMPHLESALGY